ncbi:Uma2 family endonuclease [Streptomyces sp. S6]
MRRGRLREAAGRIEQLTGARVEIIGGALLISLRSSGRHAGIVIDLRDAIRPQLPPEYEVFANISVPMPGDPDDYATPDLTVGLQAFRDDDGWLLDADAVELVVEVISPGERLKGVNEKTAWYAAAGVPRLLQIDPRSGTWSLFGRPGEGQYNSVVHGKYGETVPLPADLGGDLPTAGLTADGATPPRRPRPVKIDDVMDFLVEHRAPGVVPGYISEQLLSMAWIIDAEDVARMTETARRWLRSDDPFRVAVAIGLENETYLADSWEEISALAEPLKEKFPSMAADVDAWMVRAEASYERLRSGSFFAEG